MERQKSCNPVNWINGFLHSTDKEMAMLGTIKEWDSMEEEWMHYIERMKFLLTANDVLTEGKRRAIFLSVIGTKHYASP